MSTSLPAGLAAPLSPALAYQPAVVLFVLARRFFDLGQRDEGLCWFYQAQYRARLLHPGQIGQMFALAFDLESAHSAFMDLAGPYFNNCPGCSPERWLGTIERVRADNQAAPDFSLLYPDLGPWSAVEWPGLNQEVNGGLAKLAEGLRAGWDNM